MSDEPKSGQAPDRKKKTRKPAKAKPPKRKPDETVDPSGFTARQDAFINGYIMTKSITQGAILAGCPGDSAHVQGSRWLQNPKIRAEVEVRRKAFWTERGLHKDELIDFLLDVVRFNPGDYIEWDSMGVLKFKKDADMSQVLKFVQIDTNYMDSSGDKGSAEAKGFKLSVKDQVKAAELLLRVGGWLENKRPGDDRGGIQTAMERLAARIRGGTKP
jgi:hypothetical protein